MKLRPRLLLTSLSVALVLAVALLQIGQYFQERERRLVLERFVTSQITDDTRDRCESNPNWFLAGPRPDRPSAEVLAAPDADVNAPRPPTQALPFEYFAYDEAYAPMSSAGPRFPAELRDAIRRGTHTPVSAFVTPAGSGLQMAVVPGWERTKCPILLFRMRPVPGVASARWTMFAALFAAILLGGLAAGWPLVERLRRLGLEARHSAYGEYRSSIDSSGRDEVSALAFAFNEAATDIKRRATDVKDREESLRRYIASTGVSVTEPLVALEQRLSDIAQRGGQTAEIRQAVADAHSLVMRIQNLSVAATLRMSIESRATDDVDLGALIGRVIAAQSAFARATGVTVAPAIADPSIRVAGDTRLVEQAVNNLVDNAIRYNRSGGQATVSLDHTRDGRFSLRVTDDGPGAPDEVLARLNANRRFRGDEGRTQRPGELGLGLAIVREVSDRFGIQWAFRRNAKGWFEAELTGPIT